MRRARPEKVSPIFSFVSVRTYQRYGDQMRNRLLGERAGVPGTPVWPTAQTRIDANDQERGCMDRSAYRGALRNGAAPMPRKPIPASPHLHLTARWVCRSLGRPDQAMVFALPAT